MAGKRKDGKHGCAYYCCAVPSDPAGFNIFIFPVYGMDIHSAKRFYLECLCGIISGQLFLAEYCADASDFDTSDRDLYAGRAAGHVCGSCIRAGA